MTQGQRCGLSRAQHFRCGSIGPTVSADAEDPEDFDVTLRPRSDTDDAVPQVTLKRRPRANAVGNRVESARVLDLTDLSASQPRPGTRWRPSRASAPVFRIGSAPGCDVVIDHPAIAPIHVELRNTLQGPRVYDVSHGGAGLVVNGHFTQSALLRQGDRVSLGPSQFALEGQRLIPWKPRHTGPELRAEGVGVVAGGHPILQPVWLGVEPGELVAVLGESGAGKSTLLKALAGVTVPATGAVLVDGDHLETRRSEFAYVPQDEIVHPLLTVREALDYAAALRLPQGAGLAARGAAVARVLDEVGLTGHADQRISDLSGGQRRRVGVAVELVSAPRLLFLDEPTTGLDPGLERRMMQLFRSLAEGGRSVLLVTHATQSLYLCDRIVVMARGGIVAFCGTPDRALSFFGVRTFDELYDALASEAPQEWHRRFRYTPEAVSWGESTPRVAAGLGAPRRAGMLGQATTLTRRYARLFARDRRTVSTLALQVPVLAIATALLFAPDVFWLAPSGRPVEPESMHAGESVQMLFLVVTIALWFGSISAAREIVKERAVIARELAVGVRVSAYVLSKLAVLLVVAGVQTLALIAIAFALRPLHAPAGDTLVATTLLVLTAFAGVGIGLAASSFARSEDQAVSFIPLLLVPQLLYGGALVPLPEIAQPLRAMSAVIVAQWALAGGGTAIDMQARIERDPVFSKASDYGTEFFDLGAPLAGAILLGFTALAAVIVAIRVRRMTGD